MSVSEREDIASLCWSRWLRCWFVRFGLADLSRRADWSGQERTTGSQSHTRSRASQLTIDHIHQNITHAHIDTTHSYSTTQDRSITRKGCDGEAARDEASTHHGEEEMTTADQETTCKVFIVSMDG